MWSLRVDVALAFFPKVAVLKKILPLGNPTASTSLYDEWENEITDFYIHDSWNSLSFIWRSPRK